MEQSSLDKRDATNWECSVCGRSRRSPYATPCLGSQARGESCRTCGEQLASSLQASDTAVRDMIGLHLI
jgi:hypothetical protein